MCVIPRGKAMGGTGSINGMLYNRGSKQDYDAWEKAGNIGWSWDEVLPYFKKSEDYKAVGIFCGGTYRTEKILT